jgi:hypothetical protein
MVITPDNVSLATRDEFMSIGVDDVAFEAAMKELDRRNSLFNMWFGAAVVVALASVAVALTLVAIDTLGG